MVKFSNPQIAIATAFDVTPITTLLNRAYRGESSQQGWTTEAHLITGNVRTDEEHLIQEMRKPGSVVLKFTSDTGDIIGCVNLQQHNKKIYLGLLSVSPHLQGGGVGKQILKAAEEYAQQQQCESIYMTVISVRIELIDWYKRHGYHDTGERKPFGEDGLTGKHLQELEFVVLEKEI